tara:strand:- start:5633 stop:5986 length:354 start_codon:yes stop_codon:yes gene_type:complete
MTETICEKANRLVGGERQWSYDHPWDNCSKIAKMWSALLNIEVEPRQVAMCMIAVKLSREAHRHKEDNLVDIAGYAQVAALAQHPPKKEGQNGRNNGGKQVLPKQRSSKKSDKGNSK